MYPTTLHRLANAHTADLHRLAAHERTARAASRALRGQADHRARPGAGHAVTVLAKVLTLAGGHRPSPTR